MLFWSFFPPPMVFYFHLSDFFLYLTSQSFSNSDLCCILCSTHCFNSVPIIAIPVRLFLLILSFISYLPLISLLPLCFLFSFPLFPKQYFYLVYLSLLLHFLPIFLCFHSESSWFSYTYPCTNNVTGVSTSHCQLQLLPRCTLNHVPTLSAVNWSFRGDCTRNQKEISSRVRCLKESKNWWERNL